MSTKFSAFFFVCLVWSGDALSIEREEEIRNEMWVTPDKSFKVAEIPKKWADKSAVIIAQLNRFEYRKPPVISVLRYNEYSHYRIRLNDKNAVAKYTEITFLPDRNYGGEHVAVYVGFKIIKPGGEEILIDPAKAVKMQREYHGIVQSYNKLAIPNLEPGDILDYYICEEANRSSNSPIYFFDPVIYPLPQEYPVMKHKLEFRAERRCYINLKSLNGAPELKLVTDEANNEKFYSLEGTDMEGVGETRWIFPYREMPTVKFRAAYASGKAMRALDVLLGEPGEVKSSVSQAEIQDMIATMLSTEYDIRFLTKYTKKHLKNIKNPFELATKAYYFYRNEIFNEMESAAVEGRSPWESMPEVRFVDVFSTFLSSRDIAHDITLAVPRNVSSLDDLLMENEIEWFIRVKKGNEFMYFEPFDLNTVPGTLNAMLQGTDAYAVDGLMASRKLGIKRVTLPTSTFKDNRSETAIVLDLSNFDKTTLSVKRALTGRNKFPDQYYYLDPFDLRGEESAHFEMTESSSLGLWKKKYEAMRDAYLAKREKDRDAKLKFALERDYDVKVNDVSNFKVEQTGRYADAPALIYSFNFSMDGLVSKAGPNYLLTVGKLIEQQTKIESHEISRTNNVYYETPRSYHYRIEFNIPKGYEVQGLEKLNQRVENKLGGFNSVARITNEKVIIEAEKHYDINYAPASEWKNIVSFLNAAHDFNEQKLLLKKK